MLKYSDAFEDRSKLLKYTGPAEWESIDDLIYFISFYDKNESIFIKKGTATNLASTPCFFECIVPKERYLISFIHDALYSGDVFINIKDRKKLSIKFKKIEKYGVWINDNLFKPNRKFADLIFYYGMIDEQITFYGERERFRPFLGYLGVRIFGVLHFNKK